MGTGAYSYRDDPGVPAFADGRPLVIFDGDCVLCSGSARLLLRLDRHGRFRLTTAQSAVGAALRRHYGVTQDDADSVVLLQDGWLFLHSTAVLTILAGLERPWRWLSAFKLAPEGARDRVYRWIARRRYRLFGRRRACYVPRPQWRDRFLEAE